MNKTTLIFSVIIFFFSCKKSEDKKSIDNTVRTVSYVFAPNGVNSQIIYKNIQSGQTINAGYQSSLYYVNDQVKIGDVARLQMSTSSPISKSFEVRIMFGKKEIISKVDIKKDASGTSSIVIDRVFLESDFK